MPLKTPKKKKKSLEPTKREKGTKICNEPTRYIPPGYHLSSTKVLVDNRTAAAEATK